MRRRIREWRESPYRFIKSKEVRDDDGFITDYTWWYDERDGVHFFMFGDGDIYRPNRDYADRECDSYEEAEEWFWNYDTEELVDDRFDEDYKRGLINYYKIIYGEGKPGEKEEIVKGEYRDVVRTAARRANGWGYDIVKMNVNESLKEDANIIKVLPSREYRQKLLSELEKRLGYAPNDSVFSTIREWDKYHKEYGWTPRQYAEWAEPEEELREYVRELIYAYEDILEHWNNIMGESLKEDAVKQNNGKYNRVVKKFNSLEDAREFKSKLPKEAEARIDYFDTENKDGSVSEWWEVYYWENQLKEDISDYEIDKVYKKLSKLNKVDFGALEDEYLETKPSVKDAVYKFYGTILNTKSYCKDFVKWAKEEKGIDLKGLPCKESYRRNIKEDFGATGDFLVKFEIVNYDDEIVEFELLDVVEEKEVTKEDVIRKFPFTKRIFDSMTREEWEERSISEHHPESLWRFIVDTAMTPDIDDKIRDIYREYNRDGSYENVSRRYEVETLNPEVFVSRGEKLGKMLGKSLRIRR